MASFMCCLLRISALCNPVINVVIGKGENSDFSARIPVEYVGQD